jgi:mannan endo-1,4-beta-mannosidase
MNGPLPVTVLGSQTSGRRYGSADTQRTGRHRQSSPQRVRTPLRRRWLRLAAVIGAVSVAAAIVLVVAVQGIGGPAQALPSAPRAAPRSVVRDGRSALPATPGSYIGLYANGDPDSYAGVTAFAAATGVKPDLVLYYSGWLEPFQASFATSAAENGAVPLVQIDPTGISLAAIAAGQYDGYLTAYADAVRAYRHPVILSFGHEMNGGWYAWGNRHASPTVFVAAWRHIVNLFRALRARNVTWMWTVNIIHGAHNVPSPGPWWPGSSYVNWAGIDGYYYSPSESFDSLFGPTIVAVRALTRDPILIAETGVAPAAGQPAKIANLFAGIRLYGLLGFVWFDSINIEDWLLTSPAAFAAFRSGAKTYHGPAS